MPLPTIGDFQYGALHSMGSCGGVITPNDGADLGLVPTSALWVGGAGNLTCVLLSGDTAVFTAIPAGTWLWIRVKRVMATGTTATLMTPLY